jgi:hypothetical protein
MNEGRIALISIEESIDPHKHSLAKVEYRAKLVRLIFLPLPVSDYLLASIVQ